MLLLEPGANCIFFQFMNELKKNSLRIVFSSFCLDHKTNAASMNKCSDKSSLETNWIAIFNTKSYCPNIFFLLQDNSLVPEPWCLMVHRMLESAQSIQRMHNRYSFGHMISYEQPSYERKKHYRNGVFVKVRSHSWVFDNFEYWYKFCPCEQGYSFKKS